jgi:hypothetical protein
MDQDRRAQWFRGVLELYVLAILSARESYVFTDDQGAVAW